MKRREFLTKSMVTSSALLTGFNACDTNKKRAVTNNQAVTDNGMLAGLTLEQLRDRHKYYLFDDFLPFMEKYVIDFTYGGFLCNTDRDGANITQKKTTWYEGRGIWVYSFLYNNIAKKQKYFDIARKSVDFILKNEPKENTLYYASFTRDGNPIGEPPEAIYGDLFVANGLSEYSKTTNDVTYWEKAKEILIKCLKIYDRPDYRYHAGYGPEAQPFPGERVLGHWMILLRLATQMLNFNSDPEIEKIASRCVDALINQHYISDYKLMNEVLNHDMARAGGSFSQFVYIGHAIESLWMVMAEAIRTKNKQLFDLAAERFKFHIEVAWDDVYGGVFHCLNHVDNNIWKTDKALWAQEEVLVGLMMIIEHTGAKWAKEWYTKMWNYVTDKFPLEQYGYPIWLLYADRKVIFEPHYNRVGNFHHPRHLMLNLLSINRMIERENKVSGFFS